MSLEQLIYVSTATTAVSDEELERILESSIRHNRENGLTGILLYGEGNFLQVLEGTPDRIDEVMSRIYADQRHHDVFVLERAAITTREFGQWFMSFAPLSMSALEAPAFLNLRQLAGAHPGLANVSPGLRGMLAGFAEAVS